MEIPLKHQRKESDAFPRCQFPGRIFIQKVDVLLTSGFPKAIYMFFHNTSLTIIVLTFSYQCVGRGKKPIFTNGGY